MSSALHSSAMASNGHRASSLPPCPPLRTQVATLRAKGLGPALIAEELHCSIGRVLRHIQLIATPAAAAGAPAKAPTPPPDSAPPAPLKGGDATPAAIADAPNSGDASGAFQHHVLTLRHKGLSYRHIATRLRSTAWKVRHALSQLPAGSRPNPILKARQQRYAEVVALRRRGLTHHAIARLVGCDRSTVSGILKRHAADATPSPPPAAGPPSTHTDAHADPRTSQILSLRRQGLSIRQIAKRLGVGASISLVRRTLREHKSWNTLAKRGHETAILTLARDLLPTPPTGIAIALTSDQLPAHLEALEGAVTRLVAVERVPEVFTRMLTTLSRPFPLPLSLHLGDFWEIARHLPDPIAFLDYDGMGALPTELQAHLTALAPRLTSPAVIRLTCSMAHRDSLTQVPQAIHALLHIPGFQVTRLDTHSTRSTPGQTAMTTILTVLKKGAPHAPPHRPHR